MQVVQYNGRKMVVVVPVVVVLAVFNWNVFAVIFVDFQLLLMLAWLSGARCK